MNVMSVTNVCSLSDTRLEINWKYYKVEVIPRLQTYKVADIIRLETLQRHYKCPRKKGAGSLLLPTMQWAYITV